MSKEKPPKRYPFPELLDRGSGFRIRPTDTHSAKVDYTSNTLMVPLGDGPLEHNIRLQMQAKIQWSSFYLGNATTRVPPPVLQAVEDLRLTFLMQREADLMSTAIGFMDRDMASLILQRGIDEKNLRYLSLMLIGHGHTQVADVLREKLAKEEFDEAKWAVLIADEALRLMENSDLNDADRISVAERVEDLINEFTPPPEPEPDEDENPSNQNDTISDAVQQSIEEMLEFMLRRQEEVKNTRSKWGDLTWDRPPLIHYVTPRMVERKIRASEEGSFIRDITRLMTDQRIFGVVRRRQGGCVLIDCSGSMGLSIPVLRALVRAAPAVTVALYNGDADTGIGVLRVIVANGRMCDDKYIRHPSETGGSNVIDGPAIRLWMSQQSEPRVWVSDGMVNGRDGREAGNLYDDVIKLMRRYRVIRVPDVTTAFKFFMKLEQGKGQPHPVTAHRNALELEKLKNR